MKTISRHWIRWMLLPIKANFVWLNALFLESSLATRSKPEERTLVALRYLVCLGTKELLSVFNPLKAISCVQI